MKIACEACGAKYTIADDKVRGRRVKIRCKGCGTPIVVDGQPGGGASGADAETDASLEAIDTGIVWSVNLSDTDSRTMSVEEIIAGYASGLVTADAFVWRDGMADWVALLQSELAPQLAPPPRAAAVPRASAKSAAGRGSVPDFSNLGAPAAGSRPAGSRPTAARVQQPDNTQDLFGAIDTAGADDEGVATSAAVVPQAGAASYDDGKLTGARNENSVLFSLDALKAGFSPSTSPTTGSKTAAKVPTKSSPAGRAKQPSNPDDPFGMGASGGLMGIGGAGGVLFGGDNQALLTAPAPPPPSTAAAQQVVGAAPYAAPPARNKWVLIIGALGGVTIIGLVLALLFGQNHDNAQSPESSAPTSVSAAPAAEAEKPAPETKPEETAKPEETSGASAIVPPSASPAPEPKPAVVAVKSDAPKKPKEEPPPATEAPPFSKASAISALTAASSSASSCKKPGGPTGSGKATVTFALSGRVTTATVSGSFAGTPVGGCVASIFHRTHVPAFSGSAVTVSKSFNIN